MSRKDFNLLAWELAHVRPCAGPLPSRYGEHLAAAHAAWTASVTAVADACAATNPAFKRQRFIDACETWNGTIRNGERVFA